MQFVVIDVLDGIHAKPFNTQAHQVVEIRSNLRLHLRLARVEVVKRTELAGLYLPEILVVDDAVVVIAAAMMKVVVVVRDRVRVLSEVRSCYTDALWKTGHVVDHRIGVNIDAGGIAARHHVCEFFARAAAAFNLVADGLVTRPPGRTLNVLIRWRHLYGRVALGSEVLFALAGNIRPMPLEQLHKRNGLGRCLDGSLRRSLVGATGSQRQREKSCGAAIPHELLSRTALTTLARLRRPRK